MSETTEACVRGCGILRQHLSDCDGYDSTGRDCRGCLPRRAEHGRLCYPCHRRFELMLHDAPTVFDWLTSNLTAGDEASRMKQDFERRGGGGEKGVVETPVPLKIEILDVRDLLADGLAEWADDLCETYSLTGPDRHSVAADVMFLRTWLTSVERLEWVGDWWEWLAERFRDAHALAPWRPVMRRVKGVPCPGCGETNLAIFGGESDITCLSCKMVMTEARFGIWEQVLRMEDAS